MVWPLIAALGTAGAVGAGAAILGGMTKKEASTTISKSEQNVYHSPYENYQPSIQYAPVSSYSYQGATTIINSPGSTGSKQASAITSYPSYDAEWSTPQSASQDTATGSGAGSIFGDVDWTMIAIIGAVALVGYGLVRRR